MPSTISHTTIHIRPNCDRLGEDGEHELHLSLKHQQRNEIMLAIVAAIEQEQTAVFCGGKFQLNV